MAKGFGTEAALAMISDVSRDKGRFFGHIRKLAASWDGSDPIRIVRH